MLEACNYQEHTAAVMVTQWQPGQPAAGVHLMLPGNSRQIYTLAVILDVEAILRRDEQQEQLKKVCITTNIHEIHTVAMHGVAYANGVAGAGNACNQQCTAATAACTTGMHRVARNYSCTYHKIKA